VSNFDPALGGVPRGRASGMVIGPRRGVQGPSFAGIVFCLLARSRLLRAVQGVQGGAA